ncbi:MAG: NAD-dependent epimerase/dehydratase family protein [Neptuniibacter sp.]
MLKNNKHKVVITGVSGFLGKHLAEQCQINGFPVTGMIRRVGAETYSYPVLPLDLAGEISHLSLTGCNTIIHCAAQVPSGGVQASSFRSVNVEGTRKLAQAALDAGVKRFIFISSIKVNGETTPVFQPFCGDDLPAPEDDYAKSKWEAERELLAVAENTLMDVVIVRAPLVYGPGVKGNFNELVKLVRKKLPLPFGAIKNKRSMVGIDNLCDLIITCVDHPRAGNQVFLVSDGQDLSISELISKIATLLEVKSVQVPVPLCILKLIARLVGKQELMLKLTGSLQVNLDKTKALLGWEPKVSVDEAIRRAIKPYL